jgi:hypothetical protein
MESDLTTAPGVNNGRGSRIVLRDSAVGERPITPGASIPTPAHEEVITRGCILLLMGPMFMISIAGHEQAHEQEGPLGASDEERSHSALDLSPATERESEVRDQGERGDRGTVAGSPSEASLERASEDSHVGEGFDDAVQLERSIGEGLCPW